MTCTLVDVIQVTVLDGYQLYLQFDDGAQGYVDHTFFVKVTVNPDIGTIYWPNGADLSPTYLRENIQTEKMKMVKHA